MIPTDTITEKDILVAKGSLDFARLRGDKLKISLAESALNDLLDRYSCHSCHTLQPREQNDRRRSRRATDPRS